MAGDAEEKVWEFAEVLEDAKKMARHESRTYHLASMPNVEELIGLSWKGYYAEAHELEDGTSATMRVERVVIVK